jgi:hypothetical protein
MADTTTPAPEVLTDDMSVAEIYLKLVEISVKQPAEMSTDELIYYRDMFDMIDEADHLGALSPQMRRDVGGILMITDISHTQPLQEALYAQAARISSGTLAWREGKTTTVERARIAHSLRSIAVVIEGYLCDHLEKDEVTS